jgi:hypothetical protein
MRHHHFCVSKSRYLWRKRHKRSKTSLPNLYGPPWDDFWERMIPRPGLFHRVSCLYPCSRCECCRFCGGSRFNQRRNEKFVSEQTRAEEARKKRARKAFRQEERARDGRAAMTEYKTEALATRQKAARLKVLRLALGPATRCAGLFFIAFRAYVSRVNAIGRVLRP